jgi:hypothetical protein
VHSFGRRPLRGQRLAVDGEILLSSQRQEAAGETVLGMCQWGSFHNRIEASRALRFANLEGVVEDPHGLGDL